MHIVVCLKQVLDPEIPAEYFELDEETNRPDEDDSDMVMDTYAQNALESAIQLKESMEGAEVTAICLGDEDSEDVLRQALSFTADEAVRVWDSELEDLELNGQSVGYILAKAIQKLGGADVILTGYQASDIEEGLVGTVIAEQLKIPCITLVSDVQLAGGNVNVKSESEVGYTELNVSLPSLLTVVSSEKNVPRLPKVKDIRLARNKPITELELSNFENLDMERYEPSVKLARTYIPERSVSCKMVDGEDEIDLAEKLVNELASLKVL